MTPAEENSLTPATDAPLCVLLEGVIVPGDWRSEATFALLRRDPTGLVRLLAWRLRGEAHLRWKLSEAVRLEIETLPFNQEVLAYLRREAEVGRRLMLISSAPEAHARRVAEHLGLFDEVIASPDGARSSREGLREAVESRFGEGRFDLVADVSCPSALLAGARNLTLVGRSGSTRDRERDKTTKVIGVTGWSVRPVVEALRVHQWLKNVLVFVPLVAGQRLGDASAVVASMLAFLAFSLAASGVYVLNDLLDLPVDRHHPKKRLRPFASGRLPLSWGLWMSFGLQVTALLLAVTLLPLNFLAVLAFYLVLTLSYSLKLKGAVLIDVFALAGLYTLRVVAGSAATGIVLSVWILAFSMFLFLSLAMVKRYAELFTFEPSGSEGEQLRGRNYRKSDLPVLVSLGTASGYAAVLVLALYTVSDEAARHYSDSYAVWLLCPLLLYWISRVWIVVSRHEMHEDPLVWALNDQISRWVGLVAALILVLAI